MNESVKDLRAAQVSVPIPENEVKTTWHAGTQIAVLIPARRNGSIKFPTLTHNFLKSAGKVTVIVKSGIRT